MRDAAPTRGRSRCGLVAAAVVVVSVGCVTNPVGPVATSAAYRDRAEASVEAALGSVEAARLAAEGERDGRTFSTYAQQVVDDALGPIRTASDTFETIAPPTDEDRVTQQRVLDLLDGSRRRVVATLTDLTRGAPLDPAIVGLQAAAIDLRTARDELRAATEG